MKKILFISNPNFLDYDLCLLRELGKIADVYYMLDINTYTRKANLLNYEDKIRDAGIFSFADKSDLFPTFFRKSLNYEKSFFTNRVSKKSYSLSNLILQFKIIFYIKKISPDVIHYNNTQGYNHYLSLLVNRSFMTVLTIHDPIAHLGEENKKAEMNKRKYIKYADKYLLLSLHQVECFSRSYNVLEKDIYISQLGVYSVFNEYRKNSSKLINKNIPKVLFFGRISKYKGISVFIDAIKMLRKQYGEFEVTIAGKGELSIADKSAIIKNSIHCLNKHISNEELVELIDTHSFVVCPYLEATQSGVLMTAFAFCKPVVATNVGSFSATVKHNVTGLLVEPNNVIELSNAIGKLIKCPDKIVEFQENIYKEINTGKFSWETISRQILEVYK